MILVKDDLLNESYLMEKLGIKQRSALRRALDSMLIPYKLLPQGQIITTLSSFNMRLHGYVNHQQERKQINDEFA